MDRSGPRAEAREAGQTESIGVTIWILIMAAMAGGGALMLWHTVSQAKHTSELMLDKYGETLTRAREHRAKEHAPGDE